MNEEEDNIVRKILLGPLILKRIARDSNNAPGSSALRELYPILKRQ
jgi:hypothetical protein